jgi:hypothetical protein
MSETFKILKLEEVKDLIKIFNRGEEEDKKMFWINTIVESMLFEYDIYTCDMVNNYNKSFDYLLENIDELEINKASRDKLLNILNKRRDLKITKSYTPKQADAIKKYRASKKGKEKNNELSRKYYRANKDIPEKFEKIQESEKKSYEKLKSDPERYRKYLDRKKELYKRRKEEQEQLVKISLDEMIEDQNIINPVIN